MKIAIMQPYIFPYLGYFQLINAVDKFIILDDVNFIMRGWINRNRILVGGHNYLFSVPIKKASQNKLIYECELADGNWRNKLLKTIEYSYKEAPHFKDCLEVISSLIQGEENNLSKWLTFQIKAICNYLKIPTEIVETSIIYSNRHLKGQDRIIDICKKEEANTYYNAAGGKNLYSMEDFLKNNIDLHFLNCLPVKYPQKSTEFIPFLSIIDVMMYNKISDIRSMLNKYELL